MNGCTNYGHYPLTIRGMIQIYSLTSSCQVSVMASYSPRVGGGGFSCRLVRDQTRGLLPGFFQLQSWKTHLPWIDTVTLQTGNGWFSISFCEFSSCSTSGETDWKKRKRQTPMVCCPKISRTDGCSLCFPLTDMLHKAVASGLKLWPIERKHFVQTPDTMFFFVFLLLLHENGTKMNNTCVLKQGSLFSVL